MRLNAILIAAIVLAGCEQAPSYTASQTAKWVRQCGGQLIADATGFYEDIPVDLPADQLQRRIEGFHATEGRLLTLRVRLDQDGRPVGLGLRPDFWDNTQVSATQRQAWQSDTMRLVTQVEVALGVRQPGDTPDAAKPLRAWLGDAGSRLDVQSEQTPFTLALRRLKRRFATREDFNWPPAGL